MKEISASAAHTAELFSEAFGVPRDLHPDLASFCSARSLDVATVDLDVAATWDRGAAGERTQLLLTDGKTTATWQVSSLRSLFRGDAVPPDLKDPSDRYVGLLLRFEHTVMQFEQFGAAVLDDTLLTIFSSLRRKPDGRLTSLPACTLWQMAAITNALYPISGAEFGAMMCRLEQSIRRWWVDAGSRAYTAFLCKHVPMF